MLLQFMAPTMLCVSVGANQAYFSPSMPLPPLAHERIIISKTKDPHPALACRLHESIFVEPLGQHRAKPAAPVSSG
eukprot:1158256-Pelagomonas_calceolata.AAC.3